MDQEKLVIAVMGATGSQGGGLIDAILADSRSPFVPRAIARDPESPGARALKDRGVEVVAADLEKPESIQKAFEGAYGAFCVTFYWAHFSPQKEIAHAGTMAQAAARAGLRHVIWSTLEDTRKWIPLSDDRMPTLMGQYKVPHFDAKSEADRLFVNAGVPTTFLWATFYWDNMIHFGMGPHKDEDGTYTLTLPMGNEKLGGIAAQDIGKCAYGILKGEERYIGKTVGIAGEHLTGEEMAGRLERIWGRPVRYRSIEPQAYRALGFPGADDLGNMFQFYRDFAQVFLASRDVDTSRMLNPSLLTFDAWLERYGSRIPLE